MEVGEGGIRKVLKEKNVGGVEEKMVIFLRGKGGRGKCLIWRRGI